MILRQGENELNIRSYEISLWTLQDSFITVLKGIDSDIRGTLDEPTMRLVDDGTQELKFSIPMYIQNETEYIENPIWYTVINGNLIADMRKLKVILNKATEDEEVFEFVITKVVETHRDGQLNCDVSSEGLAFHELGKQGYKIALEYENFDNQYQKWQNNEINTEPIANLQFWNEEYGMGLEPLPANGVLNANQWYYTIEMDWSSYGNANLRSSDKVYEEEYVSSWNITNDTARPATNEAMKEKTRIVSLKNSNYYNLSQDLAKEFGVFCRYKYLYDDNYHIIGRIIVYYNNFINEKEGTIDFSYPYSSSEISREMDGTDLVTKMYVEAVNDDSVETGIIDIMSTEANLSGENYLLNFEYMYKIGTINKEQYDSVKVFETKVGTLNRQINSYDDILISCKSKLPTVQATITLAESGVQAAEKGVNETTALMNALDIKDGTADGYITSPTRTALLVQSSDGSYSLSLTEKGVLFSSVEIYPSFNFSTNQPSGTKLASGSPEYDEFNNLVRINRLSISGSSKTVYVKYKYNPKLYYQKVIDQWNIRLAKDQQAKADATAELASLNSTITTLESAKTARLEEKQVLYDDFAKLMGPALREGFWTPDNIKNCENRVDKTIAINNASVTTNADRGSSTNLVWDKYLFDGEQDTYYKLGITETKTYYPYIPINSSLQTYITNHINDQISIIYYDYTSSSSNPHEISRSRRISLGSGCQLGFRLASGAASPSPVIVVTETESMSDEEITYMRANAHIGVLTVTLNSDNTPNYDFNDFGSVSFQTFGSNDKLTPLRYKIDTTHLKVGEGTLYVKYIGHLLEEYTDYSTISYNGKYYITVKPNVLFRYNNLSGSFQITYTLSNASTAIYLDAKEVLKENSAPRVSYTIESCMLNTSFMHTAYKMLNRIININDYELKFENVQGYISALELNLDKPFEDKIEVKNYKTKFEDLFTSIVATTEQMKKNTNTFYAISQVINPDGTIKSSSLQEGISKVDLSYAFNNGTLSISNENGIWGISDSGVVAIRGGGIFTATDKDVSGNWIWNTGITPQGINAQLITTGQLDTNRIIIYAGDEIRFQMNDKGLYAYKSYINDADVSTYLTTAEMLNVPDLDRHQYVVHNGDGLFLCAEPGAMVIKKNATAGSRLQTISGNDTIIRVAITWDGFTLRNWSNEAVFFADADTGNLTLKGRIEVMGGGVIAGWTINDTSLSNGNMTISSSTGLNFNNKFVVDENGIMTITSGNGTNVFKATSTGIGFYNGSTPRLVLTGDTLDIDGTFDINATGDISFTSNNFMLNTGAASGSQVLRLGPSATPYMTYVNGTGLTISGNMNATSLTVGAANSPTMSYSSSGGLVIGNSSTGNYLSYNSSGLIIHGAIYASTGVFGPENGPRLTLGSNQITGNGDITMATGNFTVSTGNFRVSAGNIYLDGGSLALNAAGSITIGEGDSAISIGNAVHLWTQGGAHIGMVGNAIGISIGTSTLSCGLEFRGSESSILMAGKFYLNSRLVNFYDVTVTKDSSGYATSMTYFDGSAMQTVNFTNASNFNIAGYAGGGATGYVYIRRNGTDMGGDTALTLEADGSTVYLKMNGSTLAQITVESSGGGGDDSGGGGDTPSGKTVDHYDVYNEWQHTVVYTDGTSEREDHDGYTCSKCNRTGNAGWNAPE